MADIWMYTSICDKIRKAAVQMKMKFILRTRAATAAAASSPTKVGWPSKAKVRETFDFTAIYLARM